MKLVIVESPAKCSKISSFLGTGWQVMASMGHIRTLKESLDAVGIDRNWTPSYEEIGAKKDQIAKLKKAAKEATEVWLATDDDREGEGIAWHICHILKLDPAKTPRIVFHEITRPAIQAAVAQPGRLDMNRVHAQQARAMLDMLVGFTISPVLWKRVAPKLSAGRCQTPALRLVAERDAEIAGHTARSYWTLVGQAGVHPLTPLKLQADGEWTEADARKHMDTSAKTKDQTVSFLSVRERVATASAPPPLITSTLQQEASALHGLGPKATMMAAQKLYEAGHITYMRTDNPQVSVEAAEEMRRIIETKWGKEYVGAEGQHIVGAGADIPTKATKATKTSKKTKATEPEIPAAPAAQAAHEAIRPTHPDVADIEDVEHAHRVVYKLIWRRAMQSQMATATAAVRTADLRVEALPTSISWSAEQTKPLFDGWKRLASGAADATQVATDASQWDAWTPLWKAGSKTTWTELAAHEVFTKPTGRYTEATLIRELEKRGIGRPSTFASLVTTLFDRNYVEKTNSEGRMYETRHLTVRPAAKSPVPVESKETHKAGVEKNKLTATPLGVAVSQYLSREFTDLFAYEFTAHMESTLDAVSEGKTEWKRVLQQTWETYKDKYASELKEGRQEIHVGGSAGSAGVDAKAKVVQTKSGPMLVRPCGEKSEFAPLPPRVDPTTLTDDQIDAAFAAAKAAREGEMLGTWTSADGSEHTMLRKKGPYGWYVEAGGVRVPWKEGDVAEGLQTRLTEKAEAFERTVGPYMIKRGPYGFYFYKTGGKGKPTFVGIPKDADPATITEAELVTAAATGAGATKKSFKPQTSKSTIN